MPILPKSKKRKLVLTLIVYLYFSLSRYDFKNPGFKSGTGHFTQVVWQQTAEIGIGQAKSDDGKIFVVARYRPAGNFINNFQDNVKPKVRQCPRYESFKAFFAGCLFSILWCTF